LFCDGFYSAKAPIFAFFGKVSGKVKGFSFEFKILGNLKIGEKAPFFKYPCPMHLIPLNCDLLNSGKIISILLNFRKIKIRVPYL
jgi:hypothetical protein